MSKVVKAGIFLKREAHQGTWCAVQEQEEGQLTPEQLKAMKGPSRDDPVEAEGAASWVQQFNEELAAPSRNALECKASSPPHVLRQQTFRVAWELTVTKVHKALMCEGFSG